MKDDMIHSEAAHEERLDSRSDYRLLHSQLEELLKEETFYVSAMSNASALLMESLPDLNWAGFYLMKDAQLVVGPFQGRPACIHIPLGKGVCGHAAEKDQTTVVPDVHSFPGHIACDSASRSEIVIPLHDPREHVTAVLDIDSPVPDRFSREDREGLETFAAILEQRIRFR
ncbi:MAG: GAF domain-containing protein [Blautia sp.]|nr:GAF domain-containing protein [Blautia sp.]